MNKTKTKTPYRVRNWREYNNALVQRGSLTLWIDPEVLESWNSRERTGKPGRPKQYSDRAVEAALVLKAVYHLPLRATEGLMRSLLTMLGVERSVMDYTTLSRRQQTLNIALAVSPADRARHVVVDSPGVKVFGEGEWKVRKHG